MLYLILSILMLVILLDRLHSLRVADKALRHQYRLYALRDALREAAIAGKVNPRSWVFGYLDSSIAKTIDRLPQISLWQGLALYLAYKHDAETIEAGARLTGELKKPENGTFSDIYVMYQAIIITYLMDRHIIFRLFIKNLLLLRRGIQAAARVQTKAPATSTLLEYAWGSS